MFYGLTWRSWMQSICSKNILSAKNRQSGLRSGVTVYLDDKLDQNIGLINQWIVQCAAVGQYTFKLWPLCDAVTAFFTSFFFLSFSTWVVFSGCLWRSHWWMISGSFCRSAQGQSVMLDIMIGGSWNSRHSYSLRGVRHTIGAFLYKPIRLF